MNINLNNSLYTRSDSFSKGRGVSLETRGTFLDAITAALGKAKTDQYISSVSSTVTKPKLEYQTLASKWNPTKMSQDEYDEFLDFLQEKGILSEEDKKYLGHGGITSAKFETSSWYSPLPPVNDYADGNLLAYMRYQSSLIYEPETEETRRKVELHKKVTAIMEEMVKWS
jgi:hypothetical protein